MDLTLISLLCTINGSANKQCVRDMIIADTSIEDYLRVCYYTTWAQFRPPPMDMKPSDVNPWLCSHLIIAFAWIKNGELTLQLEKEHKGIVKDLVALKKKSSSLKVMVAVGGWSFGSEEFQKIIATEQSRTKFANSAVKFLLQWNLDGLDLDWEYPDAGDKQNFTLLIRQLHLSFVESHKSNGESDKKRTEPLLLAAAVPAAESKLTGYDFLAVSKYFDFVNLMAYDYYGPWDNKTGHNAPLFSYSDFNVATSARIISSLGMPKKKIAVGLASYGHSFEMDNSKHRGRLGARTVGGVPGTFTQTDGFFAYYEVCEFLNRTDAVSRWDPRSKVPYTYNDETWISYDDPKSIREKARWVQENEFGGIMIWSLDLDDFTGQYCRGGQSFPLLREANRALLMPQKKLIHPLAHGTVPASNEIFETSDYETRKVTASISVVPILNPNPTPHLNSGSVEIHGPHSVDSDGLIRHEDIDKDEIEDLDKETEATTTTTIATTSAATTTTTTTLATTTTTSTTRTSTTTTFPTIVAISTKSTVDSAFGNSANSATSLENKTNNIFTAGKNIGFITSIINPVNFIPLEMKTSMPQIPSAISQTPKTNSELHNRVILTKTAKLTVNNVVPSTNPVQGVVTPPDFHQFATPFESSKIVTPFDSSRIRSNRPTHRPKLTGHIENAQIFQPVPFGLEISRETATSTPILSIVTHEPVDVVTVDETNYQRSNLNIQMHTPKPIILPLNFHQTRSPITLRRIIHTKAMPSVTTVPPPLSPDWPIRLPEPQIIQSQTVDTQVDWSTSRESDGNRINEWSGHDDDFYYKSGSAEASLTTSGDEVTEIVSYEPGEFCQFSGSKRRNCNSYVSCVGSKVYVMPCVRGTAYNEETQRCDWPSNVPGCLKKDPKT